MRTSGFFRVYMQGEEGSIELNLKKYFQDLKTEFAGYNGSRLAKDLMAGVTVAAVALPLALAFGVGSGATAASGLLTAIISGFVISLLGGAFYQISDRQVQWQQS